jgi:hypothetical protein
MANRRNNRTYIPAVRLKSTPAGPLRSVNDYQFGFYDIGVLRDAMNVGNFSEYRVAALPIPQNEQEFAQAESIVRHPAVEYAIVDKNKLVLTLFDGQDNSRGWMTTLSSMGFSVKGGGKAAKRMKSFHRPTLINAHFDDLNIQIVDSLKYTKYIMDIDAPEYNDPEITDRILDGFFVVSSRLIKSGIENLPINQPTNLSETEEYYYDPNIRLKLQKFLASSKMYNARILTSFGIIKGNMVVSDLLPEGVDVITYRANIKKDTDVNAASELPVTNVTVEVIG